MADLNYSRRCGQKLTPKNTGVYSCPSSHTIYDNSVPAMALLLLNKDNEVLLVERTIDPYNGMLDAPGGFCDFNENFESATFRELKEEIGLPTGSYGQLHYLTSGIDDYPYLGEMVHPWL